MLSVLAIAYLVSDQLKIFKEFRFNENHSCLFTLKNRINNRHIQNVRCNHLITIFLKIVLYYDKFLERQVVSIKNHILLAFINEHSRYL